MSSFVPFTAEACEACAHIAPKVADTAVGPVEYAEHGQGPALLAVHGGPGGFDQGLVVGEVFRANGFRVIAPSRPGYLGTPLSSGASLEDQAHALAALLDALAVDKVAVVGASAGGPPSYSLARLHPDKVSALIQIDSVSMRYTKADEISKTEEVLFLSKAGVWLMDFFMRHFPEASVKQFLATESTLDKHELGERVRHVVKDPAKLAMIQALSRTMSMDYERRKAGVANDLRTLRALDKLPLDGISCPALVMHGTADNDVPPEHAEYAARSISGAELHWIDKGSHVGFWLADEAEKAQQHAVNWLRSALGG